MISLFTNPTLTGRYTYYPVGAGIIAKIGEITTRYPDKHLFGFIQGS